MATIRVKGTRTINPDGGRTSLTSEKGVIFNTPNTFLSGDLVVLNSLTVYKSAYIDQWLQANPNYSISSSIKIDYGKLNVGNPTSAITTSTTSTVIYQRGVFPPPEGIYDTSTNRILGQVYIPGGLGVEQDLNVGGFIYGRIAEATTSRQLLITATNIDRTFYPIFTDKLYNAATTTTQLGSYLYGDTTGTSVANTTTSGLTYNPYRGILTVDNAVIASNINSTSTDTGALQVVGGAGISRDVNIGGNVTIAGTSTTAKNIYPSTGSTYSVGSDYNSYAEAYLDKIYTNLVTNNDGGIRIAPTAGGYQDYPTTEVVGDFRVTGGRKPIGTAPVVTNVLWVTMDGNDTNDGAAEDASRACRTITGATRSPLYQPGTQIRVRAGHYLEDNPIEMKPYTSVMGSDLRTTSVEPINKTQDLFHVNSGCYLAFMQMTNGRSGLLEGSYRPDLNRGAFATAFPTKLGDERIDLFHSPYIQNCTNQNGPWMKDGTMFLPAATVQVPKATGLATWNANTTSMIVEMTQGVPERGMYINYGVQTPDFFNARTLLLANKPFLQEQVVAFVEQTFNRGIFEYDETLCRRDAGYIIEAVRYDAALGTNYNSVTAGNAYRRGNASSIAVTSTELIQTLGAIEYLKGRSATIMAGNTVAVRRSNAAYNEMSDIISNNTPDALIFPSPQGVSDAKVAAKDQLVANKSFVQREVTAWIQTQIDGGYSPFIGFTYDSEKCYRDVGYIVDALCYDLLYGGNSASLVAARAYFVNAVSQIPGEGSQTVAAFEHLRDVAQDVILGNSITPSLGNTLTQSVVGNFASGTESARIATLVGYVTTAITDGNLNGLPSTTYPDITWATAGIQSSVGALTSAQTELINDMITYINNTFAKFKYNTTSCQRDTGLIVDSIATDMLYNSDSESIFAGIQYWNQSGYTGDIARELTTTTAAINYVKTLANSAVVAATNSTMGDIVNKLFTTITNILSNGTVGITNKIISNGTATTTASYVTAYQTLLDSKSTIQDQTIAYINGGLSTFTYNASKCSRDVGLIVDSITQDLLFSGHSQATFTGIQYWNQNGYTGSIASELTTTTNAIAYVRDLAKKIVVNDVTGTRYQTAVLQNTSYDPGTVSEATAINADFNLIIDIITNGTVGVTDRIIPNRITAASTSSIVNAYTLLQANKQYLKAEAVAYVEATKTAGFVYDQALCSRDVGYMVDSVSFDLLYGGNRQAIQSGVYYYSFNANDSAIPGEKPQVLAAYNYIKSLLPMIIRNEVIPVGSLYQSGVAQVTTTSTVYGGTIEIQDAQRAVDIILDIITNGPSVVTEKRPIGLEKTLEVETLAGSQLLHDNRAFLVAEVIAYVNTFKDFYYDETICRRDIGYMIDSVAFDLLHGGNKQSIKSGVYYFNYTNESTLAETNEIPATTAAYNFIKSLLAPILKKQAVANTYQLVVPQVTVGFNPATDYEIETLSNKLDIITNIIRNGPEVVEAKIPMNLTMNGDQEVMNAYNILKANRAFIVAETIGYLNSQFNYFDYNKAKCFRDVGIIVENVSYDVTFGGNEKSVQSGLAYYNGVVSAIAGQETQTISAIDYLNQLCQKIVTNTTCTNLLGTSATYQQFRNTVLLGGGTTKVSMNNCFNIITNIIANGPTVAPEIYVSTGPDAAFVSAEVLMQANRQFIQQQTINYINWNLSQKQFPYSEIKCARDTGLIVDAIALDLLYPTAGHSQSTFAGLQYWNQKGYITSEIANEINETTAAVKYLRDTAVKIVQNITPSDDLVNRYQTAVAQVTNLEPAGVEEANILTLGFNTVVSILEGDTLGWTDKIIPNGPASNFISVYNAAALLAANKTYLAAEVNAYIASTRPGFVYSTSTCARDVGYIIDSVAFDMIHGGNKQSVQSGLYYYGASTSTITIPTEVPQTIAAFNYLSTITGLIIQNLPVTPLQNEYIQDTTTYPAATSAEANLIAAAVNTVTSIISSGPGVAATKTPISLRASTSTNIINAYNNLVLNKEFIKAQVIEYIDSTFNPNSFQYDEALCYRDTGLIIDAVSQDILLGGNSKSVEAGASYWNSGYNHVAGQETTTTRALNYARDIALQIVGNEPVDVITGTTVAQVINPFYQYGGDYMPRQAIRRNFHIITTIIEGGLAFTPPIVQGGGIYAATGQLADDVKIPAKITSVSEISSGTYLVGINTSTIGFGTDAILYFGNIPTYPLSDAQVEELSLEYTGNASTWNTRKIDVIGGMGGSLVDGANISDRSPVNSFVYDAFTQLCQGGQGVKITNNGYAQLVSVFTLFCSVGVQVDRGGIASIVNSNANFGDICLQAKGFGKRAFSGTVFNPVYKAYPPSPGIDGFDQYYPAGYWPNNGQVEIFVPDLADRPHISLIMEIEPPDDHVNEQNLPGFLNAAPNTGTLTTGSITINGIDTEGIAIGNYLYVRDIENSNTGTDGMMYAATGTVVTDLSYQSVTLNIPLTSGGGDPTNNNYFNLYFCGNAYYTVLSSTIADNPRVTGTNILSLANTVTDQISAHVAAIQYMNTLTDLLIGNIDCETALGGLYQSVTTSSPVSQVFLPLVTGGGNAAPFIDLRFNDTTRIIGEPSTAAEAEALYPLALRTKTGTTASGAGSAITLIEANLNFLAAEVSAFVQATYNETPFVYDEAVCRRDAGYITTGTAYDLALGTNYNAITSGIAYLRGNASSQEVITNELIQTLEAINFLKVQTGVSVGADNTALERANESYDEIYQILSTQTQPYELTFTNPTGGNANKASAKDQLVANKKFLQSEVTAWIQDQIDLRTNLFANFTYNEATCYRDVGYIVDALCYDILYGGNSASIICARAYFVGSGSQITGETLQTVAAFQHLSTVAQQVIRGQTVTRSSGNIESQDKSNSNATATEATTLNSLITIITDVIIAGNTSGLPSPTYPSLGWVSSGIQDAFNQFITDIPTIINDMIDFIDATFSGGFTYNVALCRRDSGYIIDGATYDAALGTNYNAFTCGNSYRRGTASAQLVLAEELPQTTEAIRYIKNRSAAVTAVSTTATTRANTTYDEIVNIIRNGTETAAPIVFGNPIGAGYDNNIAAKDLLIANRTFIQSEVIAWIEDNVANNVSPFGTFVYDEALCRRDSGYIITGVQYDTLLETNYNAITCGNAYRRGNPSSQLVLTDELIQTLAAINYMKTSAQGSLTSDAIAVARANEAFDQVKEIIQHNNANALVFNNPTGGNVNAIAAKDKLIANRTFLQTEVTAWIQDQIDGGIGSFNGFTYNEATCYRDVGYIVDALCYDILYGGNNASVQCARAYFSLSTSQIVGETAQTVLAYNHLISVAQNVIKGITITPSTNNTFAQVTGGNNATNTEATLINTLLSIITSVITAGDLSGLPAITYPSTAWVDAGIQAAVDQLNTDQSAIIDDMIVYINDNYGGFIYDSDTCYRDVGYIVDALCYDVLYGGNNASVQCARAYFSGVTGESLIPTEIAQTVLAYQYLAEIAGQIVQGITVTPTTGNTETQDTTGPFATTVEATTISSLISITTDAITEGSLNYLPAFVYPSVTWTDAATQTAVARLQANKTSIIDDTITFIDVNFRRTFQYDDVKCRRDVKLLMRRLIYDLESGGRYNSVMNGLSYWARDGAHHIVQLGENVRRTDLFPDGATANFYQRSYISASGYVFEYVGAGITYGALPQVGYADPVQGKETVQLGGGKVFFTSTDQNGDFRIGPGLVISQATGVLSGRTFTKSLFANMTPFILAIEAGG